MRPLALRPAMEPWQWGWARGLRDNIAVMRLLVCVPVSILLHCIECHSSVWPSSWQRGLFKRNT